MRDFEQALISLTPRLLATPTIIVANIVVFVAMAIMGVNFFALMNQDLINWGGNFAPRTMHGEWWRLVSSMFVHAGFLHLGFNMWCLWSLGKLVERLVGSVGFIVLYFVSGIAGSMASLVWHPNSVCVGASGAVFGVAGALLGLIAFRHDTVPAPVLKQLRSSMLMFLIYNIYFSLSIPGIDLAAHLGGLVAGVLCGLLLSQPLSINMVARRPLRNAALVGAGVIALSLVAMALPSPPPDAEQALQRFSEIEKRILNRENALVAQLQHGDISESDFADRLEREVLAPWTDAHASMKPLFKALPMDGKFWKKLDDYMKLREESLKLQIDAIRQNDDKKLEESNAKNKAANELAKQLSE